MHFFTTAHHRYRLGQSVPFICGAVGALDYRGVGQHRPVPAVGAMVEMEPMGSSICIDCEGLYDEELRPRTGSQAAPSSKVLEVAA